MNAFRLPALLALVVGLFASACPPSTMRDVDGGRIVCNTGFATVAVLVVDNAGNPVEGAEVKATNPSTGATVTVTTGALGTTNGIGEDLAPGTVQLYAQTGTRISPTQQVSWVCGECNCQPSPANLTLEFP